MTLAPSFSVVTASAVTEILDSSVPAAMALVRSVYIAAASGDGGIVNPPSLFLRPEPGRPERFIALPAAVTAPAPAVGIKWIGSFPSNLDRPGGALPRASAVIIVNDPETGYPIACLEGAVISATRTALSAAVGAEVLAGRKETGRLAVLGAGVIARRTVEMLRASGWHLGEIVVFDPRTEQAERLVQEASSRPGAPARGRPGVAGGTAAGVGGGDSRGPASPFGGGDLRDPASPFGRGDLHDPAARFGNAGTVTARVAGSPSEAVAAADLVLIATTATTPWFDDPALALPGVTVLHLSLRDITPGTMAACDHVVDDPTHAAREGTSLELAMREAGLAPEAVRPIGALLSGAAPPREPGRSVIYSPFGLGSLDVALAHFVLERARESGLVLDIPDFFGIAAERRSLALGADGASTATGPVSPGPDAPHRP